MHEVKDILKTAEHPIVNKTGVEQGSQFNPKDFKYNLITEVMTYVLEHEQ
jgi:hypothetical protein